MRTWSIGLICGLILMCGTARAAPTPGEQLLSIFESGDDRTMWEAYERVFPDEIHAIFADVAAKYPHPGDVSIITRELLIRSGALLLAGRKDAKNAPDQALQKYAATSAAVYRDLRAESVSECSYAAQHAGQPPPVFTPTIHGAKRSLIVAQLKLVEAGRAEPEAHGPLTIEDAVALNKAAMGAGVSAGDMSAVVHGTLFSEAPEDQCRVTIALIDGLSTMSPAPAGRYLAVLFQLGATATSTGAATGDTVVAALESDAEIGPAFTSLQKAYPDEVAAVAEEYSRRFQAGGDALAGLRDGIRAIAVRHPGAEAAADDERLLAIARTQADLWRMLLTAKPALCTAATFQGLGLGDLTKPAFLRVTTAATVAEIDALASGKLTPTAHGPPTADDLAYMRTSMTRFGAPAAQIDALFRAPGAALGAKGQCSTFLYFFEAMAGAPPPVAGRILAALRVTWL